jgi:hypothetical protein
MVIAPVKMEVKSRAQPGAVVATVQRDTAVAIAKRKMYARAASAAMRVRTEELSRAEDHCLLEFSRRAVGTQHENFVYKITSIWHPFIARIKTTWLSQLQVVRIPGLGLELVEELERGVLGLGVTEATRRFNTMDLIILGTTVFISVVVMIIGMTTIVVTDIRASFVKQDQTTKTRDVSREQ